VTKGGLLNVIKFGFRTRHSTALHCMRLTDHATLNFNRDVSAAAVFLESEKPCDTTWHLVWLHNLFKFEFAANIMRLISSFLSYTKFKVSVEDEMSSPREVQIGVPGPCHSSGC
jgi:hypothetical protein